MFICNNCKDGYMPMFTVDVTWSCGLQLELFFFVHFCEIFVLPFVVSIKTKLKKMAYII